MSFFVPEISSNSLRKGYSSFFLQQNTQVIKPSQPFPSSSVGFVSFQDKTYNRIVREYACLVGPFHIMVNAKCLVIPETKLITEANIEFQIQNKSAKVVRVYVNRAIDKIMESENYNFALLILDQPLGKELGYFGVLAVEPFQRYFEQFDIRNGNPEYEPRIFIVGQNKKGTEALEQISLIDFTDQHVFYKTSIIKGLVFCYDSQLGFLLISLNIKNLALQSVSMAFSVDKFNFILQWISGVNALPKYFNKQYPLYSESKDYLSSCELADRDSNSKAHGEAVIQLCKLSEDFMASVSKTGKIKLWNVYRQQVVQELQNQHFCKNVEYLIAEADIIVAQGQNILIIYNWHTQEMQGVYPIEEDITCCSKLNSNYFAIGNKFGEITVYRLYNNATELQETSGDRKVGIQLVVKIPGKNTHQDGHQGRIKQICILDSMNNIMVSSAEDNTIKMWDFLTGRMRKTLQLRRVHVLLNHNKLLIIATRDNYVHFKEKNTFEEVKKIKFNCIRQAAVINPKELLIVENNQVKILNLETWQQTNISKNDHYLNISAITCMSELGFVTGDENGRIQSWQIDSKNLKTQVKPFLSARANDDNPLLSPVNFHYKCIDGGGISNLQSGLQTSKNEFFDKVYSQENALFKVKIDELEQILAQKDKQLEQEHQQYCSLQEQREKDLQELQRLQKLTNEDQTSKKNMQKMIEDLNKQLQIQHDQILEQNKTLIESDLISQVEMRNLQQQKIEVLVQEIRLLQNRLAEQDQEEVANGGVRPEIQQKINFLRLSEEFAVLQGNMQKTNQEKNILVQECQSLKAIITDMEAHSKKDQLDKLRLTEELENLQDLIKQLNDKLQSQFKVSELQKVITVDKLNRSHLEEIGYREQVFAVKLKEKEQLINDLSIENNNLRILLQQYEEQRNEHIYQFKSMLNTNQKEFLHLKNELDYLKETEATPIKLQDPQKQPISNQASPYHQQISKRLFDLQEENPQMKGKQSPDKREAIYQ